MSKNGGASTGEVLRAASQIIPGDFESFYRESKFLADKIHNLTISAEASDFQLAAEYYRAADFFLHGNATDTRLTTLWDSQLTDLLRLSSCSPCLVRSPPPQGPNYTVPIYFYPTQAG